jgi:LDH2 family malate/lactate/ureidoglycolate dehydrogenase
MGKYGMRLAIDKARAAGIGMVVVRRTNHYGIAGYYSSMAAEQDMIGISLANTEAIMIPTHGRKAMLGTNPIAVCMPADPVPFWYDAATTVVTRASWMCPTNAGHPSPGAGPRTRRGGTAPTRDT